MVGRASFFLAVVISIFEWAAMQLPWDTAHGMRIQGDLGISGVLRPQADVGANVDLLGGYAKNFVDELEADTRVHPHAEAILKATLEEIELGLAQPFQSKEYFDKLYGVGQYLPSHGTLSSRATRLVRSMTANVQGTKARRYVLRLSSVRPGRSPQWRADRWGKWFPWSLAANKYHYGYRSFKAWMICGRDTDKITPPLIRLGSV